MSNEAIHCLEVAEKQAAEIQHEIAISQPYRMGGKQYGALCEIAVLLAKAKDGLKDINAYTHGDDALSPGGVRYTTLAE